MIDRLPDKTKAVFHKYANEGYTHKDNGAEIKISAGTSKWHLSEARKKLQALLKERKIIERKLYKQLRKYNMYINIIYILDQ